MNYADQMNLTRAQRKQLHRDGPTPVSDARKAEINTETLEQLFESLKRSDEKTEAVYILGRILPIINGRNTSMIDQATLPDFQQFCFNRFLDVLCANNEVSEGHNVIFKYFKGFYRVKSFGNLDEIHISNMIHRLSGAVEAQRWYTENLDAAPGCAYVFYILRFMNDCLEQNRTQILQNRVANAAAVILGKLLGMEARMMHLCTFIIYKNMDFENGWRNPLTIKQFRKHVKDMFKQHDDLTRIQLKSGVRLLKQMKTHLATVGQ